MIRANRAALAAALPLLAASAFAAEYTRDGGSADWMCCEDKTCSKVISWHADPVRAEKACAKLTDTDGITRYTRSHVFRIEASVSKPTCPPEPESETRTATCPDGQVGEWTQVREYLPLAYPTCWSPGDWLPVDPPSGACVPVPPPPDTSAPSKPSLSLSVEGNAIRLTWTAATDNVGVERYEIDRCTGASCSNFSELKEVPGTELETLNTNLPAGTTYRYRVQAVDAAGNRGPNSDVRTATTAQAPPPSGSALLTWTPPTQNDDGSTLTDLAGYRIHYGRSASVLSETMQIDVPGATAWNVTGLDSGTWYFAVTAFTSTNQSESSNVVSKTVQ